MFLNFPAQLLPQENNYIQTWRWNWSSHQQCVFQDPLSYTQKNAWGHFLGQNDLHLFSVIHHHVMLEATSVKHCHKDLFTIQLLEDWNRPEIWNIYSCFKCNKQTLRFTTATLSHQQQQKYVIQNKNNKLQNTLKSQITSEAQLTSSLLVQMFAVPTICLWSINPQICCFWQITTGVIWKVSMNAFNAGHVWSLLLGLRWNGHKLKMMTASQSHFFKLTRGDEEFL